MSEKDQRQYFQEIIEQNKGILYKVAHAYCQNEDDRQDLIQEMMIQIWKSIHRYNKQFKMSTWLYRISYNVFIDYSKSLKKTDNIEGYDCISEDSNDVISEIDMQSALKVLNVNEKVAILLHYDKGHTHNEIAKIMDIPLGTVKTNILRAKEKLKKYYNYEQNR
jgi:RNA polymerase sigma-70 factor (ECF subfamily)